MGHRQQPTIVNMFGGDTFYPPQFPVELATSLHTHTLQFLGTILGRVIGQSTFHLNKQTFAMPV